MEIGEQKLAVTQFFDLGGLRFFHLHNEVRRSEDFVGPFDEQRAGREIIRVGEPGPGACFFLDNDFIPGANQFVNRDGGQTDAKFIILDFFRRRDTHVILHGSSCAWARASPSST